jgi:hypothetical protein
MEKDKFITKVVFRKFKEGDIIALFPQQIGNSYRVGSYMHIGQHSECDYNHVVNCTKLATEAEYANLKMELEDIGYNLKVYKKGKPDYSDKTYWDN